jgi:hypothetical protein
MAYILTLLFISPFINKKEFRWFLVFYAFVLLTAKELRILLVEYGFISDGKDFFEYYSLVQMILIIGSAILLTGWQKIASISVYLVFSAYNILIYWFWGFVPLLYYDWISAGVLMAQTFILTYHERSMSKNLAILTVAWVMSVSASRYI